MKFQISLFLLSAGFYISTNISGGTLPREMFPHIDPDLWERLEPLRGKVDEGRRQHLREELKMLPDWENRLAKTLAEIAIDARYDPKREPTETEVKAVKKGIPGSSDPEVIKKAYTDRAKFEIRGRAQGAAMEMYYISDALVGLHNYDTVRFTAPLLAERLDDFFLEDSSIRSARTCAVEVLWRLKLPGAPQDGNVEAWRQWWKENRKHYEPIPAALAALEASEGGTKQTPAQSTPVPATPTPAPTTPTPAPKASPLPVASPSPATEVPATPQKPIGLILACIGAAIVIIVLIAKRRVNH